MGTAGDVCWKLAMVTCMLMLMWVTSGVDGIFLSDGYTGDTADDDSDVCCSWYCSGALLVLEL